MDLYNYYTSILDSLSNYSLTFHLVSRRGEGESMPQSSHGKHFGHASHPFGRCDSRHLDRIGEKVIFGSHSYTRY